MPELVHTRTTGHEQAGNVPAGVSDGVIEWRADRTIRDLQVGAAVDEHNGHFHVIRAGRPVKGRLGSDTAGVVIGISSRVEEHGDRGRSSREVARPVGRGVKRCAPAAFETFAANHADRGEVDPLSEQSSQANKVAPLDCQGQLDGEGVTMGQAQLGCRPPRWLVRRHRRNATPSPHSHLRCNRSCDHVALERLVTRSARG